MTTDTKATPSNQGHVDVPFNNYVFIHVLPWMRPWERREKMIRDNDECWLPVPNEGKNGVRNVIHDHPQAAVNITLSAPNLSDR